jgi:hypothetical protein
MQSGMPNASPRYRVRLHFIEQFRQMQWIQPSNEVVLPVFLYSILAATPG